MFCRQCGTRNEEGSLFCESCGARMIVPKQERLVRPLEESAQRQKRTINNRSLSKSYDVAETEERKPNKRKKPSIIGMGVLSLALVFLVGWMLIGHHSATNQSEPAVGTESTDMSGYNSMESDELSNRAMISVGGFYYGQTYTVVLKNDGTVWTWGSNRDGQLGDGTTIDRNTPEQVQGITDVIEVSAGGNDVVALRKDGTVWVWGRNLYDSLGDGTRINRHIPEQVQELTNVKAISAGIDHTIVLKDDGTIWTWGGNSHGQLGDGTTMARHTPVQIQGLANIIAISAGADYSLAVKSDGTVWAWGGNEFGRLGDGTTINRHTPVQVQGLTNIITISAGFLHSVALRNDGTVWGWGHNDAGQLADGTTIDRHSPVQAQGVSNIIAITAGGGSHTVALRGDGTVWAWGRNGDGQLGASTDIGEHGPVETQGLTNITAISAGGRQSFALRSDGIVWAWGDNRRGQLGDGTTTVRRTPVQVHGLTVPHNELEHGQWSEAIFDIAMISAGIHHSTALGNDGTVWAWGGNFGGQLGDGTTTDRYTPVQVQGLTDVIAISASESHTMALRNDGIVWTWGDNVAGQLGDGTTTNRLLPVQVQGLTNVVAVSAGRWYALALRNDGTVWAWGANGAGQLGDGTRTSRHSPVQVQNLTDIIAISARGGHAAALRRDGTVWTWGDNDFGQLGDGTTVEYRTTPVQVQGLVDVTAISVGEDHIVALRSDGTIWTWGGNRKGELGDGTTAESRGTPTQVQGLENVTAISAGGSAGGGHTIALQNDGTVWAWGLNWLGQLGDGTEVESRNTPAQVQGLVNVTLISAGGNHTIALQNDGTVWAWGGNRSGQLGGDIGGEFSNIPVHVRGLSALANLDATERNGFSNQEVGDISEEDSWYGRRDGGSVSEPIIETFGVDENSITGAAAISYAKEWLIDNNLERGVVSFSQEVDGIRGYIVSSTNSEGEEIIFGILVSPDGGITIP